MSAFDQVAALRHQNQELLERLRVKQKSYRELRRGRERGEQAGGRERGEQAGGRERGDQAEGRERGEQAGAGREGSRQGQGRGSGQAEGRERGEQAGGRERGEQAGGRRGDQAGAGREGSRQGAGREGSRQGAGRGEQAGGRESVPSVLISTALTEGAQHSTAPTHRVRPGSACALPPVEGVTSENRSPGEGSLITIPGEGGQPWAARAALTASLRSRAGGEGEGGNKSSTPLRGAQGWKQRGSETQGRGSETQGRGSETLRYTDQLLHLGNDRQRDAFIRETRRPKPILLPPHSRERKGASHVTFQSPEEASEGEGWSVRPFLGYDWIAGVLDADSSLSEKSEPFFTELRDFRQVNREECVHQEYMEAEQLDLLPLTSVKDPQVLDYSRDTHQCTHCYRVNSRLFAVPLDPQAACPVCKTPRSQRPTPTAQEPAFIR
ncbi:migration and invasion-inhibitory protein-like [Huso huso]|uniref:Migration and invasion-inhibitory protein-like n=1 Tax=Huso huso TaxID=61971 RepID=A0ABR0YYH6_HUSHU